MAVTKQTRTQETLAKQRLLKMTTIDSQIVTNAFSMLVDAAIYQQNKFSIYHNNPELADSDEEKNSSSPVFDTFYKDRGSGAIWVMINFPLDRFERTWRDVSLPNIFQGGRKTRQVLRKKRYLRYLQSLNMEEIESFLEV